MNLIRFLEKLWLFPSWYVSLRRTVKAGECCQFNMIQSVGITWQILQIAQDGRLRITTKEEK